MFMKKKKVVVSTPVTPAKKQVFVKAPAMGGEYEKISKKDLENYKKIETEYNKLKTVDEEKKNLETELADLKRTYVSVPGEYRSTTELKGDIDKPYTPLRYADKSGETANHYLPVKLDDATTKTLGLDALLKTDDDFKDKDVKTNILEDEWLDRYIKRVSELSDDEKKKAIAEAQKFAKASGRVTLVELVDKDNYEKPYVLVVANGLKNLDVESAEKIPARAIDLGTSHYHKVIREENSNVIGIKAARRLGEHKYHFFSMDPLYLVREEKKKVEEAPQPPKTEVIAEKSLALANGGIKKIEPIKGAIEEPPTVEPKAEDTPVATYTPAKEEPIVPKIEAELPKIEVAPIAPASIPVEPTKLDKILAEEGIGVIK